MEAGACVWADTDMVVGVGKQGRHVYFTSPLNLNPETSVGTHLGNGPRASYKLCGSEIIGGSGFAARGPIAQPSQR